jgi:nucleoside-diphosphate-sugar epimerase
MSDRLRLDLVLNDFVACALALKKITVLSDGTPWRPLIDTQDMARAIDWACHRTADNGGQYVVVNVGSDERNYQVRDLAKAVADAVPGTEVGINTDAPADSRSYKVDFAKYKALAPNHQPQVTLAQSIRELIEGLTRMGFADTDFRQSQLIRLKVLERHINEGRLSTDLRWQSAA